jgi:hypothetical protein
VLFVILSAAQIGRDSHHFAARAAQDLEISRSRRLLR